MSTIKRNRDQLAEVGKAIYDKYVQPSLRPGDDGKFVAIDVETSDYEVSEDDYTAVERLRARKPAADIWLMRAGFPTTCRIGASR